MGGYEVEHNNRLITVFSAPNYWYATPLSIPLSLKWDFVLTRFLVILREIWVRGLIFRVI